MRIHSDTLTAEQIATAATYGAAAGHGRVYLHTLTRHGSRSRAQAWNVLLSGDGTHSRRRTQSDRDAYAATFDAWGYFLAMIYHYDPAAVAGPYRDADHFREVTHGDYRTADHVL